MYNTLHKCLLIVSAMAAVTSSPVAAQASGQERLVLKVAVTKPSFVLYEPVAVRYSVFNPTEQSIEAVGLMPDGANLLVSITGPRGVTNYRSRERAYRAAIQIPQLPGSSRDADALLHWNASTNDWAFPVPGKYKIAAKMRFGDDAEPKYIESSPVEISITEPSGADAEAIKAFATSDEFCRLIRDGSVAYCRGKAGPACFEELDRFVRQHRASVYSPGIVWDLADSVATGLLEVTPREELAVGLFRFFLKQWPANPSAPRVMYRLAMVLDQAGRHKEAGEVIQEFEKTFPEKRSLAEQLKNNLVGAKSNTVRP